MTLKDPAHVLKMKPAMNQQKHQWHWNLVWFNSRAPNPQTNLKDKYQLNNPFMVQQKLVITQQQPHMEDVVYFIVNHNRF